MYTFEELYQLFSSELKTEVDQISTRKPQNLYEPVIYTLQMGGKRLRPVLLLMACDLFGSPPAKALPVAFAIEMFHNFTLLHDDIMDNARLRRNNETVHVKYSNNTAILSGDAMSILSYEYINKYQAPDYKEIFSQFTHTALQICEGQQLDLDFEKRDTVLVPEYLHMIGLKTAVLIASSLKIGAIIAKAPVFEAEKIYDFGFNLGMAFQIQDDYLDTFGDTSTFGKDIGGDIVANKKTYLMLKALELAKGEKLNELHSLISGINFSREKKIKKVKNLFIELGVSNFAKEEMEKYYQKSIHFLDQIKVSSAKKEALFKMAGMIMKRKS